MKYSERLRSIPNYSRHAEEPYPKPGKIIFVAVAQLLLIASLPAAFLMPAGLSWLWLWLVGPFFLLTCVVAYSLRCPKCLEQVLVAWPMAPFRTQQPYEVAILFTKRFQYRTCGQRFCI